MASSIARSKRSSPLVMILEDDLVAQELLAAAFSDAGMRVEVADTCAGATHVLRRVQPDLFVVDRHLPDGDAWNALEDLKRIAHVEDAPVIAVTGHTGLRSVERAFVAGCDAFLEKPVSADVVVDLARKLLALRAPSTSVRKRRLDRDR